MKDEAMNIQTRKTIQLTHVCLLTENVSRLTEFYQTVLGLQVTFKNENYSELSAGNCTLAVFQRESHERLAPHSVETILNRSVMLEFQVENVDKEYERLQQCDIKFVKLLTSQPWGTRSFYFRDPDGNLVNFYTRIH